VRRGPPVDELQTYVQVARRYSTRTTVGVRVTGGTCDEARPEKRTSWESALSVGRSVSQPVTNRHNWKTRCGGDVACVVNGAERLALLLAPL